MERQQQSRSMNWYKYWYYTIFFIYDSFNKNRDENTVFSVGFFSTTIYSLIATVLCVVNYFICRTGVFSHILAHILYIVIIYLFNGYLFWSYRKSRKEHSLYREINNHKKTIAFVVFTIVAFSGSFICLILLKEYFFYISENSLTLRN